MYKIYLVTNKINKKHLWRYATPEEIKQHSSLENEDKENN